MSSDPAARAGALLEIDLGAIVSNLRLLAERAAPAQCAAVFKANAYGLGAAPVARALAAAGCRMFFVASLDEGIALRQALGNEPEIAVLNGPMTGTAPEFIENGLIPVLNTPEQIAEWAGLASRVLRDAPLQGAPQDEGHSWMASEYDPHPEDAAERPSRRTHRRVSETRRRAPRTAGVSPADAAGT